VEALILGSNAVGRACLPANTGHHFGNKSQIQDERAGKKGVFTDIRHGDCLMSTHENLSIVLIQSTLGVSDSRHVLDDDSMVRVLPFLVQNTVCGDHVINDVTLADLLRAELLVAVEIEAIVVSEMVVARNGGELDTGVDEEVNEGRLHLGLTGLEVITSNEGTVALSKLNHTRNEGVLRRTVDEWNTLLDTGDGENGGGCNLFMALLNCLENVVRGVIDPIDEISKTLGVRGPENDDLVKPVGLLEVSTHPVSKAQLQIITIIIFQPDITSNLLDVLGLSAQQNVIGTIALVGSDKVWVVDTWEWVHLAHLFTDLALEIRLKDCRTIHCICKIHAADVPTTNDQIIGVEHGEHVVERDVNFLSIFVRAQLDGGGHDDGAVVVGMLLALTGLPRQLVTVGNDTGSDG